MCTQTVGAWLSHNLQTKSTSVLPPTERGASLTILDHADEGDDGQQDNTAQRFLVHVCLRLPSEDCSSSRRPSSHSAGRGSRGCTLPFITRISEVRHNYTAPSPLPSSSFLCLATKVPWLRVACQGKQGSGQGQEEKKNETCVLFIEQPKYLCPEYFFFP